jgi:adenosylcobinamide-GDP ribazoletransferase
MSWFPVVGAVVGGIVGSVWWTADRLWPPAIAAALAVAADLALTGMLHFDGLADSADGLLPHMQRERRLEVMSESTIGAYGVAVTTCVLLLRFAALASMSPSILLIAGAWCASRTVMAVAARALPYARTDGGLATVMLGGDWRPVALYGVIAAVSLGAFAGGRRTEVAVAAGLVASTCVVLFARRRLGGFTGDVLGAAGVVGETVALVVAAAKW